MILKILELILAINSLTDLKNKLIKAKINVVSFNGLFLETDLGMFTMDYENVYLNKNVISKKDLLKLVGSDD